jgi:hypothetical protein
MGILLLIVLRSDYTFNFPPVPRFGKPFPFSGKKFQRKGAENAEKRKGFSENSLRASAFFAPLR